MKLFYIGSICAAEVFERTVAGSRIAPSEAPQAFEGALLKGFAAIKEVDLEAMSTESIAPFPYGNRLFLKSREDVVGGGVKVSIASAVNLPVLKQMGHARSVGRRFRKWLKANAAEQKAVLLYGVYPTVAEQVVKLCKAFDCKCIIVVTDVPEAMLTYSKPKYVIKRWFGQYNKRMALKVQSMFDGYVYITRQMEKIVAPGKPYQITEILVDPDIIDDSSNVVKSERRILMYAGTLYKKYGIDKILQVWENLKVDTDLWICGSGDYEEEIKRKAAEDDRIKFFGRLSRKDVLRLERQATLLLNIRNPEDDYTLYSFPSKMIEYMLTATPMYTTKLPGIPQEYYDYIYLAENYTIESMANDVDHIMSLSQDELDAFGQKASQFVRENKNCYVQTQKIISFIKTLI